MEAIEVIGVLLLVFVIISMIVPWVSLGRIKDLELEVSTLKRRLKALEVQPVQTVEEPAEQAAPAYAPPPETEIIPEPDDHAWRADNFAQSEPIPDPVIAAAKPPKFSLEQQFGARLPVWIGGIALALAGVFLVKYSIDTGLLNEKVRVALGGIFGLGLLYGGHQIFKRPAVADAKRIGQSLIGAGVIDLYACIFAATSMYQLLPNWLGFIGMAAVTFYAVAASLHYGAAIALLGLAGGFLTPALIHSDTPDVPLLLLYLYFVIAGTFAVIRARGWWICGSLAIGAAFLWVIICLATVPFDSDLGIWVGLFLLAVCGTVVLATNAAIMAMEAIDKRLVTLNYLTLGGGTVLMAATIGFMKFDTVSWLLFWCLSAGGMLLAWFRPRVYSFVPFVSLALGVMLMLALKGDPVTQAVIIAAFAALYAGGGLHFQWNSDKPALWALFGTIAVLACYLTGYYDLRYIYNRSVLGYPLWGIIGLVLSGGATQLTIMVQQRVPQEDAAKQKLLAINAAAATAFLSLALSIELPRDFLPVVFAAEVLAISWIDNKVHVDALRRVAAALTVIFGLLLLPQIGLLVQLTAYSLFELQLPLQESVPLVDWPLFQLGLPALMFAGATLELRQKKDDRLVKTLEASSVALLGLMGYYLTRHLFHAGENVLFSKASFGERGAITNVLFVYGLGCLVAGRFLHRSVLSYSGLVLSAIAVFRICYFDLILYDPLLSHQYVGTMPLFNMLLLPFGLPVIWLVLAGQELKALGKVAWVPYTRLLALLLGFAWLTFTVRQLYQGSDLDTYATSNAEIYSYSIAWLLLGIGLLLAGTLRHDKLLRSASLAVMLLTIGKVFLYDAAQLSGLYRIFSFLGLGISLLGLSWFYTRFVFTDQKSDNRV